MDHTKTDRKDVRAEMHIYKVSAEVAKSLYPAIDITLRVYQIPMHKSLRGKVDTMNRSYLGLTMVVRILSYPVSRLVRS